MRSPETCRERAEECRRKAAIISDPRDRAHWLKLAEDWMILSRLPLQSVTTAYDTRVAQSGLWRGELPTKTTNRVGKD